MRNPNGFGSVNKLGGNRRRPFRARVTIGFENGKQKYKTLGYFDNYPDAMNCLLDYNKSPLVFDTKTLTFAEVYEKWSNDKFKTISTTGKYSYKSAYNYTKHLDSLLFIDVKSIHIRECIEDCPKGVETKKKIKQLFSQLYDWALERDMVDKNYAKFVKIETEEKETSRVPFTHQEIKLLWDNVDMPFVDTILILLYSGVRIKELLITKTENINLDEKWFKTGVKTQSGKNRTIPIHDKILPFFKKWFNPNNEYFISLDGAEMSYKQYRTYWNDIVEKLNLEHLPHDTRHTFVSEMHRKNVSELRVKRIIGHSNKDVTEHYTHTDIDLLVAEINKVDYE